MLGFLMVQQYGTGQTKLDEVTVDPNKRSIQKPINVSTNTSVVSRKELLKAACCNLAESFETNPAVDVNYPDAVSGAKQIKLLGLSSPYVLNSEENIPSVRGASQVYGMSFVPGSWVESIQITKGMGSVVNGYESISGQINTELIKPKQDIPFFVNMYASNDTRTELNLQWSQAVSSNWATSLYVHTNARFTRFDMNGDGFMDSPIGRQINVMNRWHYENPKTGWVAFMTVKALRDQKLAGQMDFDPLKDRGTTNHWGSETQTNRIEWSQKLGYIFKGRPFQSVGLQSHLSSHEQDSYFGLQTYYIRQRSGFVNGVFQSILGSIKHHYTVGLQASFDQYTEWLGTTDWSRSDNGAGVYAEYTFNNQDNLLFSIGVRSDYHNRMGGFVTPRFHLRYIPWKGGALRYSIGRGQRLANVFAENQGYLASSRQWQLEAAKGSTYGLNPEKAWNTGLSFSQQFILFGRKAEVSTDAYYTRFLNQVVIDVLSDARKVSVYNLKGQSYALSFQAEATVSPIKNTNVRLAYKKYALSTDYLAGSFQQPLQAQDRYFVNVEWHSTANSAGGSWKADATWNALGPQRLPSTQQNPVDEQLPAFSPSFSVVNAQITRLFSKKTELYVGIENAFDYRQDKAIVGSSQPFGAYFDPTLVYGPLFGRMTYIGFRQKFY